MSYGLRQAILIALGSAVFAVAVLTLARRQLISLRYALGWIAIASIGAVSAALTPLVEPISSAFGMSPTGVLLACATVVLLGIALQLSVSVSGLQSTLRDVAEAHALLDRRVEELEAQVRG